MQYFYQPGSVFNSQVFLPSRFHIHFSASENHSFILRRELSTQLLTFEFWLYPYLLMAWILSVLPLHTLCAFVCVLVSLAGEDRRRGHRWPLPPPALQTMFQLPGHNKANLALTASISSWHIAPFIALIIVQLRHILGRNKGAEL